MPSHRELTTIKWATDKARAARAHNETKCLLLQLPPELRTRIYSFVLGYNNIHIAHCYNPAGTIAHLSLCDHQPVDSKALAEARFDPNVSFGPATHGLRCRLYKSARRPKISIDLGLLRVCGQIYCEARLLPFASNTFTLENVMDLVWLPSILSHEQINAFNSIAFGIDLSASWHGPNRTKQITEAALRSGRLRHVVAYLSVNIWTLSSYMHPMLEDGVLRQLLPFRRLELSTASIATYLADGVGSTAGPDDDRLQYLRDRCRKWEAMLLAKERDGSLALC